LKLSAPQEELNQFEIKVNTTLQQWDDLRRLLESWSSLTSLRFSQDTRNEDYKEKKDYSDELQPKLTAWSLSGGYM